MQFPNKLKFENLHNFGFQPDTEFANMNGAMSGSSSDGAEMYPESGTTGNGDGTTFTTPEGNSMPMDQLKQMLCSQLEYYFSRYVD